VLWKGERKEEQARGTKIKEKRAGSRGKGQGKTRIGARNEKSVECRGREESKLHVAG
jgi:hypothetical protein